MNNYFKIITKDTKITCYFTKEEGNYISFQNKNTNEEIKYKRMFSIQKIKENIEAAIEGGFNMWRDTTKFLSKEEGGETAIQAVPNEIYLIGKSNKGGSYRYSREHRKDCNTARGPKKIFCRSRYERNEEIHEGCTGCVDRYSREHRRNCPSN